MKNFLNDLKLSMTKIYLISILIILTIALGFYQYGISEYQKSLDQKAIFQEVEKNKIDMYSSYRVYASFGFRVLFVAAPISAFFSNSAVLQEMTAYIDSGERLNIYKPLKGKTLFEINKYLFSDFSGIILFFGSLIGFLSGYIAFPNKEYQLFLASISGWSKQFFYTLLVRALILALIMLILIAGALLLNIMNGLSISIDRYLLGFFLEMCSVSIFFLVLGSVFGTFKWQILGVIGSISSWYLFIFIIPFVVSMIVAAKSNIIKSEYQLEIEKLKPMMDFEKQSNEKAGILGLNQKPADIDRELVMSYYKNEFPKTQTLEEEMKTQMLECVKLYYRLSSFFPTTNYLAVTNEISSKGYKTLFAFYTYIKQIKEAFFKEYLEKVYFSSQPAKVEPFLKGDENIFKSKPALPDYYLQGILFNLFWIIGLALFSNYRFKKYLFELPDKKKNELEPKDTHIKSGEVIGWNLSGNLPPKLYYNLLSNQTHEINKKGYTFKFTYNGQLAGTTKHRNDFIYLTQLAEFPKHIMTGDYINKIMNRMNIEKTKRKEIMASFGLDTLKNKTLGQLDLIESGNILLAILEMKTYPIYLINDIGKGMSLDFCIALKNKIEALWDAGSTILFLYTTPEFLKTSEGKYMMAVESQNWFKHVKDMEEEAHKNTKK